MAGLKRRYHPLQILFELIKLIKTAAAFAVFLFVIKSGSQSVFITSGRVIFFLIVGASLVFIVLKWFTHKYELDDTSFHLYTGVFTKSKRTIPFSKIQNVKYHASFFHRLLKVTSIRFETGMAEESGTVEFTVVSWEEAAELEAHVTKTLDEERSVDCGTDELERNEQAGNRVIYFTPTKKDTIKASFTSLSFLVLIPVIATLYSNINDVINVEEKAAGIFPYILSSEWIVILVVVIVVIASVVFGIARTFLKYGKYEIAADAERIYITKGMVEITSFSVLKARVQAIEIKQSALKRLLGLAEVKLICAGSFDSEETADTSSLYPFLPVERAYELVAEILPMYQVTPEMARLPKTALPLRLLWPGWFWIVATGALGYFRPAVFGIEQSWWIFSVMMLLFLIVHRLLAFFNARYMLSEQFIQFRTGSLSTNLFVSKRDKVIEVAVTRNVFQRRLGLASIGTINRANPVHHTGVNDIPVEVAVTFLKWYMARRNEIEVE
ncbi:putative membrane protein [Evansella caseinilytica]|uniref:Putative membrane protein n=1 Tax=Evansella caseinilytica TaxID=1503961 RepID=A0A1H3Q5K1_9BACI|nr:PH domain-containing protein [Evansella caseinilytica]SDZ08794.1 putative membrane protein [Evansella caseinilytica]